MHIQKRQRVNQSFAGNAGVLVLLLMLGVFMIVPFIYVVNNAFKPIEELFVYPPRIFVKNPTLLNFSSLFNLLNETSMPFLRYFFNTLTLTAIGALGQIILSAMCAYSLSKIPFPGSRIVFKIIVFSLMFSSVVTQVPIYVVFSKLKLMDTFWAMILPPLSTTLGLYLMKQFMENTVPDVLLEAARIDGASELRIFMTVVMPLLRPAWMTLIILSVQNLWNTSSPFTYSESLKTLPQALAQITVGGISRFGVSTAISFLMILVPLGCFVLTQSSIIDTMGSSGIKD